MASQYLSNIPAMVRVARYHSAMSPLRRAVLAQIFGGAFAAAAIQIAYPKLFTLPAACAVLQGLFAALASHKMGAPRWWVPIHLVFVPLAVAASRLAIPPGAWLGGFLLLFMLFWRTDRGQVPLFLTNRRTAQAVADVLPTEPFLSIDLGCGTGSLVRYLARKRPESLFVGIEHAPLPFLLAWARSLSVANLTVRYGDFWHENLGRYQVVYAFLSPVPMVRLWQKSCAEMGQQGLLISNSFAIPGIPAKHIVEVGDRRRTRLFCYLPAKTP